MSDKTLAPVWSSRGGGWVWSAVAVGSAAVVLLAAYLTLRFAPSAVETAIVVVAVVLLGLAFLGYVGAKRGHAAPFVAIALILPYLLLGVTVYAGASRAAAEVSDLFDSTSFDSGLSGDQQDSESSDDNDSASDAPDADDANDGGERPPSSCFDAEQFGLVKVGMTQTQVTRLLRVAGSSAGGGAGGFTREYADCAGSGSTFYVTFDSATRPYRVAEKRHL